MGPPACGAVCFCAPLRVARRTAQSPMRWDHICTSEDGRCLCGGAARPCVPAVPRAVNARCVAVWGGVRRGSAHFAFRGTGLNLQTADTVIVFDRCVLRTSEGTGRGRGRGRETQRGRLRTACGQRRVDSKNSQTTPATTSTSSIRQLLGATDTQTAHHATFSTAPTHQLLGSANAATTPARAPAAAADRTQRPDAICEGKNG